MLGKTGKIQPTVGHICPKLWHPQQPTGPNVTIWTWN